MKIGIVGATGLVGRTILSILEERKFPVTELFLFSSFRNAGTKIKFKDKEIVVRELKDENLEKLDLDIILMSAGSSTSKTWFKKLLSISKFVIDNSSAFRRDSSIPLVVPEINFSAVERYKSGFIANPNCSTIQLVLALDALRKVYPLESVEVVTLQSVSGSGMKGIKELENQIREYCQGKELKAKFYNQPIFSNLIPFIGEFKDDSLYCEEEEKVIFESQKILEEDLPISVTTIRVPVFYSHSEVVTVKFKVNNIDLGMIKESLINNRIIKFIAKPQNGPYPAEVAFSDYVWIGRLRKNKMFTNSITFFLVADNLRIGAALNAVKIAEQLVEKKLV